MTNETAAPEYSLHSQHYSIVLCKMKAIRQPFDTYSVSVLSGVAGRKQHVTFEHLHCG